MRCKLALLSDIINQALCLIPSKAWIGDGFSVDMGSTSDFLVAWLEIALDHDTFYETFDVFIASSCVQNVFDDTDLLLVFPELEWLESMMVAGFTRCVSLYFSSRS